MDILGTTHTANVGSNIEKQPRYSTNITHWKKGHSDKGTHKVPRYMLLAGGEL